MKTRTTMQPAEWKYRLYRDPWMRLVFVDEVGREHVGVEPARAFPISEPGRWVSLCGPDGRELLAIDDVSELPDDVRRLLIEELDRREFLPVVKRILHVSLRVDPSDWEVETDRGVTRFSVDQDEDIRRLGPYRALITDSQGIRYLIPDTRDLDAASRRTLERFL